MAVVKLFITVVWIIISNTPPLITIAAIDNSQTISEINQTFTCQWLCEDVSKLSLWPVVLQLNFIIVNQLSNKMIFSINMLSHFVEDIILWQCNCWGVVAKNSCCSLLVTKKIPQHPFHPNCLTRCSCCCVIFNFSCWQWHYWLRLGGPWNHSDTQMKKTYHDMLFLSLLAQSLSV